MRAGVDATIVLRKSVGLPYFTCELSVGLLKLQKRKFVQEDGDINDVEAEPKEASTGKKRKLRKEDGDIKDVEAEPKTVEMMETRSSYVLVP
jgi:hypothetical protein